MIKTKVFFLCCCVFIFFYSGTLYAGDPEAIKKEFERAATALTKGDTEPLRDYIQKGYDIKYRNNQGLSFVLFAGLSRNVDVVAYTVEQGADINAVSIGGGNMIFLLTSKTNLPVLKYLVEHGANLEPPGAVATTPLHVAAAGGVLSFVKLFVEHGANVNRLPASAGKGLTMFTMAAMGDNPDVVDYLIRHGMDIDQRPENRALLHLAEGNAAVIDLYLRYGADPKLYFDCDSPLYHRCFSEQQKSEVLSTLLNYGLDPNYCVRGDTPLLIYHVQNNLYLCTETLLKRGANVNAVDKNGQTALNICAKKKNANRRAAFEKLLLSYGAIRTKAKNDKESLSPQKLQNLNRNLADAVVNGDVSKVRMLLDQGANPNDCTGSIPILFHVLSANTNSLEMFQMLVDSGANYNVRNVRSSFLRETVKYKDLSILKYLLDHGADVNELHNTRSLMDDAYDPDIMLCLVEHGLDTAYRDSRGQTALHLAVSHPGSLKAVAALIERNADVNARDNTGSVPLTEAMQVLCRAQALGTLKTYESGFVVFRYLVQNGADVNYVFPLELYQKQSLLYFAALTNHPRVVKYLIEHGADVNHKCSDGTTVFDIPHLDPEIQNYLQSFKGKQ